MSDIERVAIWYVAVLLFGSVAMVVESRRARTSPGCETCGSCDDARLYAEVDGRWYCSRCWLGAGRPWPTRALSPLEVHEAELATRERMTARGGLDRHLVRNGKT